MFSKSTQGCKKKPSKTRAKSIKCSDITSEHIAISVRHLQHFGRTMSDVRQYFPALSIPAIITYGLRIIYEMLYLTKNKIINHKNHSHQV